MSKFQNDAIFWVDVDKIDPNPYQPRRDFNEEGLRDLAESIRQYGVLQPLTVTRNEETKEDGGLKVYYELIAGERRLRAAKMANLSQVPVTIRDEKEDAEVKLELAIIENLQREDLNPIERAEAFNQLSEEFDFTHKEIAGKIGKSREYVSNSMRLLKLPEKIKQAVIAGKITEGHTRPIMMLRDKPEKQQQLFKEVVRKDLTVRETEERARRDAQDKVRKKENKIDPETKALEEELSDTLGTRVTIEKDKEGGKLVIDFFSDEDLEGLIEMVKNNEDASMDDVMKEYASVLNDNSKNDNSKEQADEQDKTEQTQNDKQAEDPSTEEAQPNTSDITTNKQSGQSMAETLGTMIQQARAEQESNEKAEPDDGSEQEEDDESQQTSGQPPADTTSTSTEDDKPADQNTAVEPKPVGKIADSQDVEASAGTSQNNSGSTNLQTPASQPDEANSATQSKESTTPVKNANQSVTKTSELVREEGETQDEQEALQANDDQAGDESVDKIRQENTQSESNQQTDSVKQDGTAVLNERTKQEAVTRDNQQTNTNSETTRDQEQESGESDQEDDMYAVSNFSV